MRAFGLNVGGTGVDVCTTSCQAGSAGVTAGELDNAIGVAVAGSGDVYVADELNNRIDEFSQSGSFVRGFGLNVGRFGCECVRDDLCIGQHRRQCGRARVAA